MKGWMMLYSLHRHSAFYQIKLDFKKELDCKKRDSSFQLTSPESNCSMIRNNQMEIECQFPRQLLSLLIWLNF